ncbi:MAG: nicotinamidase [Neisseria sp.]|nr:nicotinamidase [Neisseria sp.]
MIVAIDVDAQKTFTPLCPNELPVVEGTEIVAELNAQAALADLRVMTKDAHSPTAKWLVQTHGEMLQPTGMKNADVTWVSHAMVGSYGFELIDGLPDLSGYDYCVWKGVDPELHPYGACFHDIEERLSTGLLEWLCAKDTKVIVVGGLATDYCVKSTVLQLLKGGDWRVIVNAAACRGIAPETIETAWNEMYDAGAIVLENAEEIKKYLKSNNYNQST